MYKLGKIKWNGLTHIRDICGNKELPKQHFQNAKICCLWIFTQKFALFLPEFHCETIKYIELGQNNLPSHFCYS